MSVDPESILASLRVFVPAGQVTELRVIAGRRPIHNCFYRDHALMVQEALRLQAERSPAGLYFVPNPIAESCIPVGVPRLAGSADAEAIVARRWLLIDVDPVRFGPDGERLQNQEVPATEEERLAAWDVIQRCHTSMEANGFLAPVIAGSGNGWHLCYPINLPNDQESYRKIAAVLEGLDDRCGNVLASVDQRTKDAPRIWKLYGTISRKGAENQSRRHRHSFLHSWEPFDQSTQTINNTRIDRMLRVWASQNKPGQQGPLPGSDVIARARAYLEKEDSAISGSKGHDRAFHVACVLIQGFRLSQDQAMAAISDWNARCQPPWSDYELKHKFDSAEKAQCDKPLGYLLEASRTTSAVIAPSIGEPQQQTLPDGESLVIQASTVEVKTVEWLWPGRIPLGKLTTFAGVGGLGKTFVLLDITSRITQGLAWPDGSEPTESGSVLFVSGEDDPDDTLVPRLMEMGADLSKVFFLSLKAQSEFTLRNIKMLEAAMEESSQKSGGKVRFIAIDPPTAYLGGIDDHKNAELRQLMTPLQGLAQRHQVAIVFNTHVNKPQGKVEAMMRVMGSVAWVNAVRAAYMFARDPDDPEKRLFVGMKMNIAKERKGLAYKIQPTIGDFARVEWLGEVDTTADQAVNQETKAKPKVGEARDWLIARFREKPEWVAEELKSLAESSCGIKHSALWEAKKMLGLLAKPIGRPDGTRCWMWRIPPGWKYLDDKNVEAKNNGSDEAEF